MTGSKKSPRHIRPINNGSDAIGCVGYRPVVDPPLNIRVHTAGDRHRFELLEEAKRLIVG